VRLACCAKAIGQNHACTSTARGTARVGYNVACNVVERLAPDAFLRRDFVFKQSQHFYLKAKSETGMALDSQLSSSSSVSQSASHNPFDRSQRPSPERAALEAEAAERAASEAEAAAGPRRVLVVESDIDTADLVIALLENEGHKVEVATDGQYGLMLADSFEPHLILLALSLPGMSGYEVTQVLRNEPRYAQRFRHTRIFYLTSKDHMLQKRFHSLPGTPMSDYIFKPIDIPELLDKVARAFGDAAHHPAQNITHSDD